MTLRFDQIRQPRPPQGYAFDRRSQGDSVIGLGVGGPQTMLVFARHADPDYAAYPLVLFSGPRDAPALLGTEQNDGVTITIGLAGVTAIYHDGMWGPPTESDPANPVWETSCAHSLTLRWDGGTLAVRGAKSRGVGVSDLVAVARSALEGSPG